LPPASDRRKRHEQAIPAKRFRLGGRRFPVFRKGNDSMNLIGKILVVLNFVASVVFMSFAVMVYATHRNWRE